MTKLKDDLTLLGFFKHLQKVHYDQRLLVIVTHGFIELLLNTVIEAKCKNSNKIIDIQTKNILKSNRPNYPHSVKLVLLNEINLVNNRLFKILDWFRGIRNKAAHQPFFELTQNDLDFANKSMVRFLPVKVPAQDDLLKFCTLLVGTIWNENLDILRPVFGAVQSKSLTTPPV